ncbi:ATP-grasp fold amidoligase family protein [Agathobacter rectalis]|uniref:ATP-grasp fold amidoligase family protein n=1 Tax=Agathobacter rectalis TaxID=39491 RepID=UPI00157076C2|nr:ATP-grasp fold amidoligase family protein [Agathobacter rectalis]NSI32002.1 glycosyl transferase [Agathobacter rectalis]NSI86000.1 glycosyl transferase [Agathobacter rectalis]
MGEKKHGLRRVAGYFVNHRLLNWMPDKPYLQIFYYAEFGKFIDFKNPKTFNEKLNWLKLYYRRPDLITLVDKYEVKKYIADKIGEQYVIPTLGVWDKFEDINFNELPNQFVLKCTHDSGGLVVCKDKSKLNLKEVKAKIEKSLTNNYYLWTREWPYKGVKPRIIEEKYMEDQETGELRDYKFFCFNGEPKLMFVASERGLKNTKFDFYDMQFHHMNIVQHYPNSECSIEKPEHFEKMVMLAEKLSAGFPHVRVDFYEANGQVYFGEMTFYHFGAIVPFETEEWDKKIGDWLVLPDKIN